MAKKTIEGGMVYNTSSKLLTVNTLYAGATVNRAKLEKKHKITLKKVSSKNPIDYTGTSAADIVTIQGAGSCKVNTGGGADFVCHAMSQKVTVNAGTGNDTVKITNSSYDKVLAGEGNDKITISGGQRNSVDGGSGSDRIYATESVSLKAYGGEGNDTMIGVNLVRSRLDTGADNDFVTITGGQRDTVSTGEGADKVRLSDTSRDSVVTGDSADTVTGSNSSRDTIKTESGNDRVSLFRSEYTKIYTGSGSDRVTLSGANHDYVSLYTGNDYIKANMIEASSIYGGSGVDTIIVDTALNTKIWGGDGSDKITVTGAISSTVSGGSGNDRLIVEAINNSISAGTGNDLVSVSGSLNKVLYSGGSDTVWGLGETDSLKLGTGVTVDTMTADSETLVVSTNKGTLKIVGAANSSLSLLDSAGRTLDYSTVFAPDDVTLEGTTGNDVLEIAKDETTVIGLGGNDSVFGEGGNNYGACFVTLGSGDDYVSFGTADSTIKTGAGDDTFKQLVQVYTTTIDLGEGDDRATVGGNHDTIIGGAGNDELWVYQNTNTVVDLGSGNDTVEFFGAGSSTYSNHNLVKVTAGNNQIRFSDSANDTVSYGGGNVTIASTEGYSRLTVATTSGVETVGTYTDGSNSHIVTNRGLITELNNTVGSSMATVGTSAAETYQAKTGSVFSWVENYAAGGDDLVILNPDKSDQVVWELGNGNDTIAGYNNSDYLKLYLGTITGDNEGEKVYTANTEYKLQQILVDDYNTTLFVGTDGANSSWEAITLLGVGVGSDINLEINTTSTTDNLVTGNYRFNQTGTYTSKTDSGLTYTAEYGA